MESFGILNHSKPFLSDRDSPLEAEYSKEQRVNKNNQLNRSHSDAVTEYKLKIKCEK